MDSMPKSESETEELVININTAKTTEPQASSCSENSAKSTYEPIKTFQDLISYGETDESSSLGRKGNDDNDSISLGLSLPLSLLPQISVPCPGKTVPLNKNFSETKVNLDGSKHVLSSNCPKTLVCHDFKGGYGDDRFVDGTGNHENYVFRHWLQTDIFCYFSHHFITIPPLGWINAAHSHGVKILGTIITEWTDGVKLCDEILTDSTTIDKVVDKLALITKHYGFEGFLVNIENELRQPQVPLMIEFLEKLTKAMKQLSSDNLVIWYDSVTVEGALKWQDCLNDLNNAFFTACDGIYLNYNWNDEKLKLSVEKAGERKFDVYVGVDVFGRGCFGGGGVNTCLAVEKIYNYQLSYAIFAPGWSFECHPYDSFHQVDDTLWIPCSKYFYFRCLKDEFHPTNRFELLSPDPTNTCKKFKVFFSSNFSLGYGMKDFAFGQEPNCQPWFDLSRQSFQPVLLLSCDNDNNAAKPISTTQAEKVFYDVTTGFSGGGSLRICNYKRSPNYVTPFKACPIWFPLQIPFSSKDSNRMSIAVLAIWKSVSVDHQLQIYLEVSQKNMQTKKILLGSVDNLAASVGGKYYIHLKLSHFFQECDNGNSNVRDGGGNKEVEFFFRKNNYDEKEVNGWRISCFLFDLDESQIQKYTGINSIRIGATGDSLSLGFLSLAQITHYTDL